MLLTTTKDKRRLTLTLTCLLRQYSHSQALLPYLYSFTFASTCTVMLNFWTTISTLMTHLTIRVSICVHLVTNLRMHILPSFISPFWSFTSPHLTSPHLTSFPFLLTFLLLLLSIYMFVNVLCACLKLEGNVCVFIFHLP